MASTGVPSNLWMRHLTRAMGSLRSTRMGNRSLVSVRTTTVRHSPPSSTSTVSSLSFCTAQGSCRLKTRTSRRAPV